MKVAVLFITLFFPIYVFSQSVKVEVTGAPDVLKKGSELVFNVDCEQSLNAEIAVFTQTYLGYQANAELTSGKHAYKMSTAEWKPGQYYILVKGEHVHVQHEFVLKE
jgi:hypothetical protein